MVRFFQDKIVIVTGSSNGIGRAAARMFAKQGAKVTITGRNPTALSETKQACFKAGAKDGYILEVLGDLEDENTGKRLVEETVTKFGGIDALVNNAGMNIPDPAGKMGFDASIQIFDRMMNVNVRSIISIVKAAQPHLEKSKGAIVNVSSLVAYPIANLRAPFYSMSKATVDQLTVQMAATLIEKGIRVNCVNPGGVATDFVCKAGVSKDNAKAMYAAVGADTNKIPLGRIGVADDIANVIVFLADRSKSEYIVGQRILADGGSGFRNCLISTPFK